jgi:hypothetical protein
MLLRKSRAQCCPVPFAHCYLCRAKDDNDLDDYADGNAAIRGTRTRRSSEENLRHDLGLR